MNFLVVNDDEIVRDIELEGVKTNLKTEEKKVSGEIIVSKDSEISLCFLLHQKEIQNIDIKIRVEDNVNLKMIMNCALVNGTHNSNFKIEVGEGGSIEINERHFHGENVKVNARVCLNLKQDSKGISTFEMRSGNGGRIDYFLCSNLEKRAKLDTLFKGRFRARDNVRIEENIKLIGEESSAIVKTKTVGMENSEISFRGKIIGKGKNSKGHVECSEIVMDNAIARASPELEVIDETSRLTHEAAIGKIDEEKIKLLMAKGLEREDAIHRIIMGVLT